MSHRAKYGPFPPRNGSSFARLVILVARNLHWGVTAILIAGLVPALSLAKLPYRINWLGFLSLYWVGLMIRSILVATLLYVIGFPLRETLAPFWGHYWRQKPRFFVLALFAGAMLWEFGWAIGLILISATVAFLEFFDRIEGNPAKLARAGRAVLIPAAYLFVGLVLVFCYNDVIASVEFVGEYSETYNKLDSILLGGLTVSQIAHSAMRRLPLWVFSFFEFIYFGMFGQIGAALIMTALFSGKRRALGYVGTLLTAYYISIIVFFLWPGMSPFTTCPGHFSQFPRSLDLYQVQKVTLLKPRLLWAHTLALPVDTDYYIAFPCMHIALPLIVLWFVRKWRRIAMVLIVYDVVLAAAILLLEQHYLVDLLGGVLVAAVAIAMVNPSSSNDPTHEMAFSEERLRGEAKIEVLP
jgi:PAP2 superfamily